MRCPAPLGYADPKPRRIPRPVIRGGQLNYLHRRSSKVHESLDKLFGKTAEYKPSWHSWGQKWGRTW